MIRHIFIGTFKDGVSEETKRQILADMQAMQEIIPGVAAQAAGFTTGWVGPGNQIAMTVDFETKEDFDAYMVNPYHTEHVDKLGTKYFDRDTFVTAQYEF